jgi:hypothetical protein
MEGKHPSWRGYPKAMKPVDSIKQPRNEQWQMASDHRERAERAAHILRIIASANRPPERPIADDNRGTLLDTYG